MKNIVLRVVAWVCMPTMTMAMALVLPAGLAAAEATPGRLPAVSSKVLPRAVTKTTRCGLSANWSGSITEKLSSNVTLTYWGANTSDGITAYCYKAKRSKITKGSYMTLAIDGVGRYTSGKSITRLVRLTDQCVRASVLLFKKNGKGQPKTYWQGALQGRQCG